MQHWHNAVSTDKPYKMGMQQDPSLLGFKLFLEQFSSLRTFKKKEKRRDKCGQTNSSLHFHRNLHYNHPAPVRTQEDTSWEIQGKKLTFRKYHGVSCGSAVIPGMLPHGQPRSPPEQGPGHTYKGIKASGKLLL